ncbi:hypothetical protein LTR56_026390 [Elasticomyces elasticus]|nr:hypothetical protein LTR56_026390 [Elasticomyces elasticus]KAK3618026.1 hypothetical protein LTR22_026518 [Elasticomyces elasticus]
MPVLNKQRDNYFAMSAFLPRLNSTRSQAECLYWISGLFFDQNKIQGGQELYWRALHAKEEAWSLKHNSALSIVKNLAIVYKPQNKIQVAEEKYLRVIRGDERARGPKHKWTLHTVESLSALCFDQVMMQEAEEMYGRALAGYRTVHAASGSNEYSFMPWMQTVIR